MQPGWSAAAVILCFQQRMATTKTSCLCLLTKSAQTSTQRPADHASTWYHGCVVHRLFMQECNVGRTFLFGELWIERDLHDLKSITTSGIPGAQLDAHIAMRVAGHNASKRLLDRAELEAQQDYKARLKDELTQDGQQALLLGAGSAECPLQNSPGAMMRGCMKAVQDLQNSDAATPWRTWHVKQVFGEALNAREAEEEAKEARRVADPAPPYPVRYYQRADCNDTIVFSSVYKRPSTRNNTWVSIRFRLDDDKWTIWAGHVQFWTVDQYWTNFAGSSSATPLNCLLPGPLPRIALGVNPTNFGTYDLCGATCAQEAGIHLFGVVI
ncbi:hypothetical protein V8C86DRAFT_3036026 [Haematococcus lacustris]